MGVALLYGAAEWPIGRTEAGRSLVLAVEPLAGARVNHLRGELATRLDASGIQEGRQVDQSQTWIDPLVGVNVIAELAEHWAIRGEADIGGFGVGSELTWNAQAILTYRFTSWATMPSRASAIAPSPGTTRTAASPGTSP